MRNRVGAALVAAAVVVLVSGCVVAAGDLGGATSRAVAVNSSGIVVGTSDLASAGRQHAFKRLTDGTIVDLGTVGDDVDSEASDINDAGTVVGTSIASNGSRRAVRWNAAGFASLVPTPGLTYTSATAIDSAGRIIGSSSEGPFVYDPATGTTNLLDEPPEFDFIIHTYVTGMNDVGVAVGVGFDGTGLTVGMQWDLSTFDYEMIGHPYYGGGIAKAYDINDAGVIAGENDGRPAIWSEAAGLQEISTDAGSALAIGDDGVVAGTIGTSSGNARAFRWSVVSGLKIEVNAPSRAIGIGPSGLTVGEHNGKAALFYPESE